MEGEKKDLNSVVSSFSQSGKKELKRIEETHTDDIPNDVCRYAYISRILIENSFHPRVGDFNYFFSTSFEDLFIWTYETNTYSALISNVNPQVKKLPFWKTAGRLIQLAFAFVKAFELLDAPVEYRWIYYFNPKKSKINEMVFYNLSWFDEISLPSGRVHKATEIAQLASIIEFLDKDVRAYNAISFIYSAFELHNICLNCELSLHPLHDHLSKEPEQWNKAEALQNLELSVIQSCKAVESILGMPPNRKNKTSVMLHREKWKSELGLNPDERFTKAGKSYLEFYYELFFNLRNPSAHSLGSINYSLKRKMAVEAQCFAAIILREYIIKNSRSNEDAIENLKFNKELLSNVQNDLVTNQTK